MAKTKPSSEVAPKRVRGRARSVEARLGASLDKYHLRCLRAGGFPILDKDGEVICDKSGKPVLRPLSASFLEAVRKRLLDRGEPEQAKGLGDPVQAFMLKARAKGMAMAAAGRSDEPAVKSLKTEEIIAELKTRGFDIEEEIAALKARAGG